jgi:hypothetical protein
MAYQIKRDLDVVNKITARTVNPSVAVVIPEWLATTAYALGESIQESNKIYKCIVAHTSAATFGPDLTANNWVEISASTGGSTIQTLTDGLSIAWDGALGTYAKFTLNSVGSTLQNIANPVAGQLYVLTIQNAGVARYLTLDTKYRFNNSNSSGLISVKSGTTTLLITYDGTNDKFIIANSEKYTDVLTYGVSDGGTLNFEGGVEINYITTGVFGAITSTTIGTPATNFFSGLDGGIKTIYLTLVGSTVDTTYIFSSYWKNLDGTSFGNVTIPAGERQTYQFYAYSAEGVNIPLGNSANITVVEDRSALSALTPSDKDIIFVQDTLGLNPGFFIYDSERPFGDVEPSTALKYLVTFDDTLDLITTSVPHALTAGTIVRFSNTAPANPLSINPLTTDYYIINPTATTFQVSLTNGGVAVNLNSSGSPFNQHYVSTVGGWFYPISQVADKIHQFWTYEEYQTDTTTVFKVGDWINVKLPRQSYQVTLAGTGFSNITTQALFYDPQGLELPDSYQFSDSFTPDVAKYGRNYYGGIFAGSSQPLVIGAMLNNGAGPFYPSPGEKIQFVIFNMEATDKVVQFDPSWKDSTGTAITNQTVPANGQIRLDFEGTWTSTLPELRQIVSSGGSFDEVANFAALAALPATTGDLKMVTNEAGRQYLLRYDSTATIGLVPSSGTIQPGVEIIGYNVVPNNVETASAHNLSVNDAFIVAGGDSTTLIFEADLNYGQTYYVKTVPTATTFTLSDTLGGPEKVFTITMGSPQNSDNFVYTPGWWNVVSGGSQLPNEIYLTPRIIDQNNKGVEVNNSSGVVYWDTQRGIADYATTILPGGVDVASLTQDAFTSVGVNGVVMQDNVENTRLFTQAPNNAQTEPWISGEISTVEKLGIYTYAGSPETFITANKGAICFDTTTGVIYRKTTDATNTGWNSTQLLSTKTADYTVTEADEIIEVDTTAGNVEITLPNTLTAGKKITIIWIAGANTLTITSVKNMVDFDGVPKLSITPTVLHTAYSYINGSVNYQLV